MFILHLSCQLPVTMPTTIFWGLEAMAEDDDVSSVEINTNEYSWRERLEKLGFKVDRTFESHPTDQSGADHGGKKERM